MCALAWMHLAACTSFSTSRSDVTSTEIRIRKLEYNLSKLLAHRDKIATETGEKLEAKRKQEQEDAAFFKSIADTNDGLIKIEAARAARSVPTAVRGCERIARIARFELLRDSLAVSPPVRRSAHFGYHHYTFIAVRAKYLLLLVRSVWLCTVFRVFLWHEIVDGTAARRLLALVSSLPRVCMCVVVVVVDQEAAAR